jgi:acetyl-CoA carboxylase carboxyl transferase subunit beta
MDAMLKSENPLEMPGYEEKLNNLYEAGLTEAIITGLGDISGYPWAIAAMDSSFLMGSMGTVVGEKIVKLTEYATGNKLPLIIFATSGGARMQEGIMSLMQMAKTTAALGKHHDSGLLYISVLTDPTFGGVSASFATVADVILAEPEALIGFAGPRVIKQTIKQVLPAGFQSSEFLLEHGLIDRIVPRAEMGEIIGRLSKMFDVAGGSV